MDYPRRRGRRRRGDSYAAVSIPNQPCTVQQPPRQWCFTNSITSFLILSSLIGIIYLMLDYHCYSCSAKADTSNLVQNIEQITKKLLLMQQKCYDFDTKISHLSLELPKLEAQMNILEALANTGAQKEGWNSRTPFNLSNLDELLKLTSSDEEKNNSVQYFKCSGKSMCLNPPQPITVN